MLAKCSDAILGHYHLFELDSNERLYAFTRHNGIPRVLQFVCEDLHEAQVPAGHEWQTQHRQAPKPGLQIVAAGDHWDPLRGLYPLR